MPATRPGKAFRQARNASVEAFATGTAKTEPIVARTVSSENGSVHVADQDDAPCADRVDGADHGAEIAGVAHPVERHPDLVAARMNVLQRQVTLGEHADHHLRVVAPRDRRQHLFADLPAPVPPAATVRAATFSTAGLPSADLANTSVLIDQPSSSASMTSFSPSAMKGVLLVAEFLQRQRLDVLDQRIGEAGDLLDLARRAGAVLAHAATQRENSEVDSARPADFSRMTSSPDSTVPPMPANASRISAWIAKNDARME